MKTTLLAAAIVFATSTPTFSQDAAPAAPPARNAAAEQETPRRPVRVMGKLVKVEGNDFLVAVGRAGAQNEVRVTLDENDTALRLDGEPAAFADLKSGMIVDIAELSGRRPPGQAKFQVSAQVAGFSATVVKVDGNNLVVRARQPDGQQGERTVPIDASTIVKRLQGAAGKLADLQPDARVYITPETGTATRVRIMPPRGPDALGQPRQAAGAPLFGRRMMGTLVKVEGKSIVIRPGIGGPADGRVVVRRGPEQPEGGVAERTFTTDETTRFLVDGGEGKLEDLKPDMQVSVSAPRAGQPAEVVTGHSRGLTGMVVRVDGADVVLRMLDREERGKEVTVATDGKTKVIYLAGMAGTPKSPTVADLQPDMMVSVLPVTGVAQKIIVVTKAPGEPQP